MTRAGRKRFSLVIKEPGRMPPVETEWGVEVSGPCGRGKGARYFPFRVLQGNSGGRRKFYLCPEKIWDAPHWINDTRIPFLNTLWKEPPGDF
ncbi:hypothetical protein AVEN_102183-1 [Araneus ventricosus]|uniref:Uncharacterized protein n=1 Tax=Araneus ventricosus TaxID=182803 RepID=A0A4Y2U7L8_ARAVE|nr:hypothetical protein AVEN_102183-1 [Araneus ventricosus]